MYLYRALFKIVLVLGFVHSFHDVIDQQGDVLGDALFCLFHEVVKKGHSHEPLLTLVRSDSLPMAISGEHAIQGEQLIIQ
jgi:hypothetical protein